MQLETIKPANSSSTAEETATLLIVDDAITNRKLLKSICKRIGYEAREAADGHEALKMLKADPVDLVLLDINMPGMSGDEVLRELKRTEKLRHIPIVIISTVDEIAMIADCIELGADDYLTKPFNKTILRARIGACIEKKRLYDREISYRQQIETDRRKIESLLRVILPDSIADELKSSNAVKPKLFNNVAVLFCDIAGFTKYCDSHSVEDTVDHLQVVIEAFENLAFEYELEKIKTIGDCFMAACGLLKPNRNPVSHCVECGLKMIQTLEKLPPHWQARIGIHFGSVMGGIIGHNRFLFDIWGDTVNTASRMEQCGMTGTVNLSECAWNKVSGVYKAHCRDIEVKGKGVVNTYSITSG